MPYDQRYTNSQKDSDLKFWYWWDDHVVKSKIGLVKLMLTAYAVWIGCLLIAYSLINTFTDVFTQESMPGWLFLLLGTCAGMIIVNLTIAGINTELSSKVWDEGWNFHRHDRHK